MCRAKGTLLTWVQIAPSYSTAAGLCPALHCLNVNTLTSAVVPPWVCRRCIVSTGACDVESVATFHACQQAWTGRCRQLWPVWLVGNADQGYRWAHLWPWSALGYHDNVNNESIICFVHKASKMHFFSFFNGDIIVPPFCFLTPTTAGFKDIWRDLIWKVRLVAIWKAVFCLKKTGGWGETISSELKVIHHLNMGTFSV